MLLRSYMLLPSGHQVERRAEQVAEQEGAARGLGQPLERRAPLPDGLQRWLQATAQA